MCEKAKRRGKKRKLSKYLPEVLSEAKINPANATRICRGTSFFFFWRRIISSLENIDTNY
jgi:hypothetical protein